MGSIDLLTYFSPHAAEHGATAVKAAKAVEAAKAAGRKDARLELAFPRHGDQDEARHIEAASCAAREQVRAVQPREREPSPLDAPRHADELSAQSARDVQAHLAHVSPLELI
jgi:hypothetical protein